MTTETLSLGLAPGTGEASPEAGTGLVGRLLERIARSRRQQAEAHVAHVLSTLSDQQLADIGLDAGKVARVRAAGSINAGHWIY